MNMCKEEYHFTDIFAKQFSIMNRWNTQRYLKLARNKFLQSNDFN